MKNSHIFFALLLLIFALSDKANSQAEVSEKKVTLGDLIRRVQDESRGSKISQTTKSNSTVPEVQQIFKNKEIINLKSVKPPNSAEIYSFENEDHVAYEKTLNLQINELYKMTEKLKTSKNRGELWLRLGELYVEKANIIDNRKQIEYDKALADFISGRLKIKPRLDLAEAREYNKKAIQLYDWFLKDFPQDPKSNQALYFLGYNNFELGNVEIGTKYYMQLTNQYPSSEFANEAHFALGETYFESEKWSEAYKEYAFLIKNNKHHLHAMALYKSAWCLYRVGKTEQAIKYMDYIIQASRKLENNLSGSGRKVNIARLESEATKDLAIFFADTNDMNRALAYFKNLNTKASHASIEKLAYYLSNNASYDAAREIFQYLILKEPFSRKSFEYQYKIVQNYYFSKNSTQFKSELINWITNYGNKSSWYSSNKSDSKFIKECDDRRESTLRNYVLQQHQAAQKSNVTQVRLVAEEAYQIYFQEFSEFPRVAEMRFFFGELLFDLAKYEEASIEYIKTSESSPENQYSEKAFQNAILALGKTIPNDVDLQKKIGESLEPLVLSRSVLKFIAISDAYLKRYPNANQAAEVRFRSGRLYYLTNHFEQAERRFKEIIELHPQTKYSLFAANLILDAYSLKKDFVGLSKIGNELLSKPHIASSSIGKDIKVILEKSSFKHAQNLELDKKYLDSALQFQNFGLSHEKSELAPMAFYNAAINFERAGQGQNAINNYKRVLNNKMPQAMKLNLNSKRLLAKLYQDSGGFAEAADLYFELSNENKSDPLAMNYVFNAAAMYEITNQADKAISSYKKYITYIKNKSDLVEINFKISQLLQQAKKNSDAIESYKKFLELPMIPAAKRAEALFVIYEISVSSGLKINSIDIEDKLKKIQNATTVEDKNTINVFLAKLNFLRAQETFKSLKLIGIPVNAKKQKIAVDKKLEILNILNQQLSSVIKLNSADEIISSLYLIGLANEHMAQAFSSVPIPSGLTEEQRKLYTSEIQKITVPFVIKSEEGFVSAIEKGRDLQTYNEAYLNSYRIMNKKHPAKYFDSGERASAIQSIDWMGQNDL